MFPLGSVLLPGEILPLHVFEPRYRRMIGDCLASDGQFGVVLIERGREVGGGDQRTSIGSLASILRVEPTPAGTLSVWAGGGRRIAVERWLEDDPYPHAEIVQLDDEPGWAQTAPARELQELAAVVGKQAVRLGEARANAESAPSTLAELISAAPLGAQDRYTLLAADPSRLDELAMELLGGLEQIQRFRLAGEG